MNLRSAWPIKTSSRTGYKATQSNLSWKKKDICFYFDFGLGQGSPEEDIRSSETGVTGSFEELHAGPFVGT